MRHYTITVGGKTFGLDVRELASDRFEVSIDGQIHEVVVGNEVEIVSTAPPKIADTPILQAANSTSAELTAPLPGVIVSIDVSPGEQVSRGDQLLTIEAMKMRNAIRSSRNGVVSEILVAPGEQVGHGDVLLRFGETP